MWSSGIEKPILATAISKPLHRLRHCSPVWNPVPRKCTFSKLQTEPKREFKLKPKRTSWVRSHTCFNSPPSLISKSVSINASLTTRTLMIPFKINCSKSISLIIRVDALESCHDDSEIMSNKHFRSEAIMLDSLTYQWQRLDELAGRCVCWVTIMLEEFASLGKAFLNQKCLRSLGKSHPTITNTSSSWSGHEFLTLMVYLKSWGYFPNTSKEWAIPLFLSQEMKMAFPVSASNPKPSPFL